MTEFNFFEIVEVLETTHAAALGVSGTRGVVLGISEGENETRYGVLIGDESYMLAVEDMRHTGESVSPESIYSGESIRVPPEHYPEDE